EGSPYRDCKRFQREPAPTAAGAGGAATAGYRSAAVYARGRPSSDPIKLQRFHNRTSHQAIQREAGAFDCRPGLRAATVRKRTWLQVTGAPALAGQCVEAREGERLLGEILLVGDTGRSTGCLELPMPPPGQPYGTLTIWLDGRLVGELRLPDADVERLKAFRA